MIMGIPLVSPFYPKVIMNGENMAKTIVAIWFSKIQREEPNSRISNPSNGLGILTKDMFRLIIWAMSALLLISNTRSFIIDTVSLLMGETVYLIRSKNNGNEKTIIRSNAHVWFEHGSRIVWRRKLSFQ